MSENKSSVEKKGVSIIPKGTVLCDSNNKQQWIIGDALNIDSFQDIYAVALHDDKRGDKQPNYTAAAIFKKLDYNPQLVFELSDHESMMISNICNPENIAAWKDKKNLRHLGVPSIISSGYYIKFNDEFYSYMITQRYGDNLQQLFKNKKKGFILLTIYKVIGQMIHVLEYIHSLGYYNIFCISSDKLLRSFTDPNEIYLDVINYGKTPECLTFKSRDAQVGKACGDLESLMYMALDWMKLKVPWNDSMDNATINKQKVKAFNNIEQFLKVAFGKFQVLAPIRHFMKELASTPDANEPDYDKFRLYMSDGIRNSTNVNYNLDSGIDFKTELNLRRKSAKYVEPVDKKASITIPSQKLAIKAVEKKGKRNKVLKKKIQRRNNQVKACSVTLSGGLQFNGNMQLDNKQKLPAAEENLMINTAKSMTHTIPVTKSISGAASTTTSATKNKALESSMINQDPDPLQSTSMGANVVVNITITLVASTTMPIKKQQRSEMTKFEPTIISSNTKRGAKRDNQQAEESTVSSRSKRLKVVSTETKTGERQEEGSTETKLLKKKKKQQQPTTSSVDTEKNLVRTDSNTLDSCNARVDDSIQKSKLTMAIQALERSEQQKVDIQMKNLQKNLERIENELSSYDALREAAAKEPKTLDYIQAAKKRCSFHQKAFVFLRCQFLDLLPKAHKNKISTTELWNKICCVDERIKKIEDSLNKCVHALSMASSRTENEETSAGSTNLQTLVREDEESRRRVEEKTKKSKEKSDYGHVTMADNLCCKTSRKTKRPQ